MLNPAQFPAMSITTGGHTKDNLRQALDQAGIQCNAHADALFDDPRFTISPEPHAATVLFITVAELRLPRSEHQSRPAPARGTPGSRDGGFPGGRSGSRAA